MFNRYSIIYEAIAGGFIITDKLKQYSWLSNKKYTNRTFSSVEQAQGYLYGKGKKYAL
jgi:hypothetical protein